ncbi:MAG: cell division protein [Sorangium cellulosum]|nr:MAG: cell division protein [Sorangium cellulosum]
MIAKRKLPSNRRIAPEDVTVEKASAGKPGVAGLRKVKKKARGSGQVRRAMAGFRSKLQGLKAAASIAFVVAASITLAWGIKQHVVTSPRFAVGTIRVEGTTKRTAEQVVQTAGLSIGMNVFSVDLTNARRRLLEDPWIAEAEVERKLPSTLTINVTEREAMAVVVVDADLYLCTHEGEIFKKLESDDPSGLVVINGLTSALVAHDRKLATERIQGALQLLSNYEERGPSKRYPVQEINIGDDGSLIMTVGKGAVTLQMGHAPYGKKLLRAARVLREVRRQKAEPAIVFLDNNAHPERVVVRMR